MLSNKFVIHAIHFPITKQVLFRVKLVFQIPELNKAMI